MSTNIKKLKREPEKHGGMAYEIGRQPIIAALKLLIVSIIAAVFLFIADVPIIFPILSILAVALPIIDAINYVKNTLNNFEKYCAENNIEYAAIEQEWEKAVVYRSQGSVVAISDKHLIMHTGAYKWENVLWIYNTVICIKVFKNRLEPTDHIRVCLDDGNHTEIIFSSMDAAVFMDDVKKEHPEIVVGYDSKLDDMYHNHIDEFKHYAHLIQAESSDETDNIH